MSGGMSGDGFLTPTHPIHTYVKIISISFGKEEDPPGHVMHVTKTPLSSARSLSASNERVNEEEEEEENICWQ